MKISLNWLKDYVAFDLSVEDLMQRFTMSGIEVEGVHKVKDDVVFDVEITPNRPDCLNMFGLARECGAVINQKVTLPVVKKARYPKQKYDISIDAGCGCAFYKGILVEEVTIAKTDNHILSRIASLGLRSINNVVDITNFCLLETGQPLHAFDADKLVGNKIHVRRAKKGETIVTIDGVQRELDPSVLVIADAQRPVAIAGVMGGLETEVSGRTKNILLESAYFDPVLIRRTSRKLGLSSDSSYRFERGVNPDMVVPGAERALALILEQAGGKVTAQALAKANKVAIKRATINLSVEAINVSLGASLTAAKIKGLLKRLGFEVTEKTKTVYRLKAPAFRQDIQKKDDVLEEVARVCGYDQMPVSLPVIRPSTIQAAPAWECKKAIRAALSAFGLNEVISFSMINAQTLSAIKEKYEDRVRVLNPLTKEQEMMRPALLPSLLNLLRFNINHGQKEYAVFELGKVYTKKGEREVVGLLMTGAKNFDWRRQVPLVDLFDLKGVCLSLCDRLGVQSAAFSLTERPMLDPAQTLQITVKKQPVGVMGKIDEDVLEAFDIKQVDVYFAQIELAVFLSKEKKIKRFVPFSEYPAVVRDLSIALDQKVPFAAVQQWIKENKTNLLKDVALKEEYRGQKIGADKRNLVLSFLYRHQERTLTEDEVNGAHDGMCQKLVGKFDAQIR